MTREENLQLPLDDFPRLADQILNERLLRVLDGQSTSDNIEDIINECSDIACKLSGYNVRIDIEGEHFVFETESEMFMFKIEHGE